MKFIKHIFEYELCFYNNFRKTEKATLKMNALIKDIEICLWQLYLVNQLLLITVDYRN